MFSKSCASVFSLSSGIFFLIESDELSDDDVTVKYTQIITSVKVPKPQGKILSEKSCFQNPA